MNFVDGAKVFWNGAERPTTFVSSSEVHAAISGGDLVVAGTVGASVSNPAPGGGESNTLTFLIHPEILLTDAEIAVSKSGPAEAVAGENFVYTLTASNSGPLIATNVIFTDTLPANVSFVSADDPDCLANGSVVACKMGKVVIGGSKSVNITVHADTAGTANNSTFATLNQHDPDPSNNTSATVVTNILPAEADLSVSMSAPAGAAPGSQFDYTIVVGNDGPVDATNVTLTDVLPAGVSYVSSNFPGAGPTASCTEASGTVTCALGTLLKNTTTTVTITVQVNTLGELSNTASVTADQPDPNPANNTSAPVIVIGLRTTYLPLAVRQP